MTAKSKRGAAATEPILAPATISEYDGVRYLHLGTPWVQGAMRLGKSLVIELEYVQRMMVWMLLRPAAAVNQGHFVQLGLGAGAITRFCHRSLGARTTAVEINPSVIDACRLWFRLPAESARFEVVEMDAAAYVADPARAETAQVLCVDLYDHDAAGPVHDSAEFYQDCFRLLADAGVMTVNLFGRDASFERSAARIAAAFGAAQVRRLQPTREGNTVVVALKNAAMPDRSTLGARADEVEARWRLPARKWLKMIRALDLPESLPPHVPADEAPGAGSLSAANLASPARPDGVTLVK